MSRPRDDASHVRSVHFDRGTRTLRVVLDSGSEYNYADVPEHLYDELARSGSPDQFFRENIRDEFIGTRADDVDLAEMAKERREDALLGAPLAEHLRVGGDDERMVDPTRSHDTHVRGSHHTWIVDVVDEGSAAVEVDGREITPMPRWILPIDARDGDVLRVTHTRSGSRSTLSIEVDRHATRVSVQRSAEQIRDAPPADTGDIDPL